MSKELIGYYKAGDDEDELIAQMTADFIRKGIWSGTDGLDPKVADRVNQILAKDEMKKSMDMLTGDFDPDQPRDENGQWTSTGASSNGIKPDVAKYEKQLAKYQDLANRNPNNSLYKESIENWGLLVEHAKHFAGDRTEYEGIDAILAVDNLKRGTRFELSGAEIGNGIYRRDSMRDPYSGKKIEYFKSESGRSSFASNVETIAMTLCLVRGGLYKDRKEIKVKILED